MYGVALRNLLDMTNESRDNYNYNYNYSSVLPKRYVAPRLSLPTSEIPDFFSPHLSAFPLPSRMSVDTVKQWDCNVLLAARTDLTQSWLTVAFIYVSHISGWIAGRRIQLSQSCLSGTAGHLLRGDRVKACVLFIKYAEVAKWKRPFSKEKKPELGSKWLCGRIALCLGLAV